MNCDVDNTAHCGMDSTTVINTNTNNVLDVSNVDAPLGGIIRETWLLFYVSDFCSRKMCIPHRHYDWKFNLHANLSTTSHQFCMVFHLNLCGGYTRSKKKINLICSFRSDSVCMRFDLLSRTYSYYISFCTSE